MEEGELIGSIAEYFRENIFERHMAAATRRNARLSAYKINPIAVKYLSRLLEGQYNAEGVAKALYYPRVLGTSMVTIFGTWIQKMFIDLGIAEGSMIDGIDIEFIDTLDGRRKWCQLKSGPNNINADDVQPMLNKFNRAIARGRTNDAMRNVSNTDFIVGVLYGGQAELSNHYRRIDQIHPVIIGRDFWRRITGHEHFYDRLVVALHETILGLDTSGVLDRGYQSLVAEIRTSDLFDFPEV